MNWPKKLTPTYGQIGAWRDAWTSVMGDYYDAGGDEDVDYINFAAAKSEWHKVYRRCCEIGADEVALKLTGGKIL